MAVMLGSDYFYKGNALTITEKAKTGANPEVANMDKKRMVLFAEPEENAAVQLGIVKELTGEESINARQCFSNKTTTQLTATIILEVNGKIKVNGKINEAALERWTNIDFPNCFTSKSYLVDNITKFQVNTTYTTDAWREKMRNALFHILFNNKSEQIEISKAMSDETEEYMLDNDLFLSWFKKYYVIDETTNDMLTMTDLTHKIMADEQFWKSLTKKQQREEYSKKALINKIKENIKLKQYYFDKKKIKTTAHYSVILNVREKTDKEIKAEEEGEIEENVVEQ
jgi:phage/plasmid-associated DNA primase